MEFKWEVGLSQKLNLKNAYESDFLETKRPTIDVNLECMVEQQRMRAIQLRLR